MDQELNCDNCGGAGFFGSGPYVENCMKCVGLEVLVEGSMYRFLVKKPFGLANEIERKRAAVVRPGSVA